MKKIFLMTVFSAFAFSVFAQDFQVPKDFAFETPEDYKAYEEDVLKTIDWLIETPSNAEISTRMEANNFLLQWMIGSPEVTIELHSNIVTFMESSPELLMIYLGGFAKHCLTTEEPVKKAEANFAAIETLIGFYQKNKEFLKEDQNIEEYIGMQNEETLLEYIEAQLM